MTRFRLTEVMAGSAFLVAFLMAMTDARDEAAAAMYDLGGGTSLGIISSPLGNVNDPASGNLVCFAVANTCSTKNSGQQPNYTGSEDINSAALFKSSEGGVGFNVTSTGTSGTWQQTWQGTAGELLAHYATVKAAGSFHVIGYDLSLITAALVAGDIITGSWTTGGILNAGGQLADMGHVSLYNTRPAPIPLPAALPLLGAALALLGLFGWRRRSTATA